MITASLTPHAGPAAHLKTFYWLVRRELWEHRLLVWLPLLVAAALFVEVLIAWWARGTLYVPLHSTSLPTAATGLGTERLFFMVMPIIWLFYSLDALTSEQDDGSILFWKSLPVSDTATVMSKLAVVTVISPLLVFAVIASCNVVILALASVVSTFGAQIDPATFAGSGLFSSGASALLGLTMLSLNLLPAYSWCLLISAWSPGYATLIALLLPFMIMVLESIFFGTSHLAHALFGDVDLGINWHVQLVLNGEPVARQAAEAAAPAHSSGFAAVITSLDAWLATAITCFGLFGAIWVRRNREP